MSPSPSKSLPLPPEEPRSYREANTAVLAAVNKKRVVYVKLCKKPVMAEVAVGRG